MEYSIYPLHRQHIETHTYPLSTRRRAGSCGGGVGYVTGLATVLFHRAASSPTELEVLGSDRRIKYNDISAMPLHIVQSIRVQSGWQHSDPPSSAVLRHSQEGHRDLAHPVALESRVGLCGSGGPVTSYLWQSAQIEILYIGL